MKYDSVSWTGFGFLFRIQIRSESKSDPESESEPKSESESESESELSKNSASEMFPTQWPLHPLMSVLPMSDRTFASANAMTKSSGLSRRIACSSMPAFCHSPNRFLTMTFATLLPYFCQTRLKLLLEFLWILVWLLPDSRIRQQLFGYYFSMVIFCGSKGTAVSWED